MDDDQQFCLRWNNHQSTLISVFDTLLENETLVDCTLAAEGKFLKAHKVVLSACSPYFATLLQEQYDKHPIFILKDVKYQELRAMMDYMYRGEVNISQDQLAALLKAAESLQIKGLSDNRTGGSSAASQPKPEATQQHHRGGKLSGAYTLEQTKRARLATAGAGAGLDASADISGSREGSSSPSRRRRKVRRRSMENDAHDNSNSSVLQQAAASNQSLLQQTSAGLAVSALVSTQLASTNASPAAAAANQPLTSTNLTKKTESAKLTSTATAAVGGATAATTETSDAINTENVQQGGAQGVNVEDHESDAAASTGASHTGVVVKQLANVIESSNKSSSASSAAANHKQNKNKNDNSVSSVGSEMVIEPKAEYDDDAHDENVEDLTMDEDDMTMEELDQTAGTSQGGEGSSQNYGAWQHDRSQDDIGLMAAQDAQQRDPQDEEVEAEEEESFGHDAFLLMPQIASVSGGAGKTKLNQEEVVVVLKEEEEEAEAEEHKQNDDDENDTDTLMFMPLIASVSSGAAVGKQRRKVARKKPSHQCPNLSTATSATTSSSSSATLRRKRSRLVVPSSSASTPIFASSSPAAAASSSTLLRRNNSSSSSTSNNNQRQQQQRQQTKQTSAAGQSEAPYICQTCGRQYQVLGTLTRHMRKECNQPKKYVCRMCGRGFHYNFKLQDHYYYVHKGSGALRKD
ncbi:longitudinals lacking protein, isoforms H/M/V isoform X9 [Drosophila tropicalis]|uniref:longitudinals lacking protein, isoforms H/M/V isoform X9 n=1 Tax=Drosophila tropicalis TaxID=46794 RepID=UPI0035AB9A90